MKYSRQRESIKQYLDTHFTHPTAETVYLDIKKDFPNISLGTVYRNLNLLADMGEILRISTGVGPDHFDGKHENHYHVVCTECGAVSDVDIDLQHKLEDAANERFDGLINGHVTQFYGLCSECYKQKQITTTN